MYSDFETLGVGDELGRQHKGKYKIENSTFLKYEFNFGNRF